MATTRIKDLSKTATTVASDANIVIDGSSNGTQKITRDNFRQDTADAYVAAPSTYKLAPLNGVNKIDGTYLPTSGDTPKGEWNASTNSPTLADGTGTAGDYYDVTTAGTANLGSGAITYTVGDVVKYNGATWFKIDSVANILDGISTVDPAKVALQIPNVGTAANEVPVNGMLGDLAFQSSAGVVVDDLTVDGQLTAAVGKPMSVNGPSMHFDGVDDHVSFAAPVGSAFSFTNSTDDTPFSSACWIKFTGSGDEWFYSKYQSGSVSEYTARVTGGALEFQVRDTSADRVVFTSDSSVSDYNGKWIHVSFTYGGSGPNSANSFANAGNAMTMYLNGKPLAATAVEVGTYSGMTSTAAAFDIGRLTTIPFDGEIRDVKLFNKELSLAEVREVYSNGQLPNSFSESTGAIAYVSDFSSTTDSFTTTAANIAQISGPVDSRSNLLRIEGDGTTANHGAIRNVGATVGKRYRVVIDYNVQAGNTIVDGVRMRFNNGSEYSNTGTTAGGWGRIELESIATDGSIEIYLMDGAVQANAAPLGDFVYISGVTVTQIGSVLDARAENYNQSAGKLLDVSGNDFVGTQSGGVTLLTPRSHLSAGTLDLTNLPTSASGLSAGEVYNDSGILKIV